MKFTYDSSVDTLVIEFDKPTNKPKKKIANGMIADIAPSGELASLEILSASTHYPMLKQFVGQAQEVLKMEEALQMMQQLGGLGNFS